MAAKKAATKSKPQRTVQCYHCRRRFEISPRAMTVSCPGCNKAILVQDVIVKTVQSVTKLQTCGRIVVHPKARVIADLVEAHQGVEVKGVLEAKLVKSDHVVIGPKAKWKGDCRALTVRIDQGAIVHQGAFAVPDDDLELSTLGVESPEEATEPE